MKCSNINSLQYLPVIYLFRGICQYLPVYCGTRVQQQMVTYFRRFLSRAMFSPPYFRVSFCLFYIRFTTWASALINNVCCLVNGFIHPSEVSNLSCFLKIPKFHFIVSKHFQFFKNTRNLILVSLTKRNLQAKLCSFVEQNSCC